MGVVAFEQWDYPLLPYLIVIIGNKVVQWNEIAMLAFGDLLRPLRIAIHAAAYPCTIPSVSGNRRTYDHMHTCRLGILYKFRQVPSIAVYRFLLPRNGIENFAGIRSDTAYGAPGPCGIIQGPSIVMAKLDKQVIAGFHLCKCLFPQPAG